MPFTVFDPTTAATIAGSYGAPAASGEGYTFGQLQNEVYLTMGSRNDVFSPAWTGDLASSRAKNWINEAYTELCEMLELEELKHNFQFTATAGQGQYNLPTGVGVIRKVSLVDDVNFIGGGKPLIKVTDIDSWRRMWAGDTFSTDDNILSHWMQWRKAGGVNILGIWMHPPAAVLSVDFWVKPAWLSTTADYPIIDKKWHGILVDLASSIGLSRMQEPGLAAQKHNEVLARIRSLIPDVEKEHEGAEYRFIFPRTLREIEQYNNQYGNLRDQ